MNEAEVFAWLGRNGWQKMHPGRPNNLSDWRKDGKDYLLTEAMQMQSFNPEDCPRCGGYFNFASGKCEGCGWNGE